MKRCVFILLIMFAVMLSPAAAGRQAGESVLSVELTGAGASFPAPLITTMADEYREVTGGRVTVNYQSIGSGGGIRQFKEQTIMFGATEAYLSYTDIADIQTRTGGTAYNMVITLGSVAPAYHVPGVPSGITFTGELLADMFLGRIANWNDPRLKAVNPGITFPNLPVQIAHRSDGSGTTNVWTDYLSKVSPEWRDRIGFGTSVNWSIGIGANGNEGVAGVIMSSPGSLGYLSLVYATLNDIPYGAVINASGNAILPDLASTTAAADMNLPEDTRVSITDTESPNGFPVSSFAWIMIYEHLDQNRAISTRSEAEELIRFLYWCITDGQKLSEPLDFAPLPDAAVSRAAAMLRSLTWKGEIIGSSVIDSM